MKKTKIFKIFIAVLIAITIFITFSQNVFAFKVDIDKFNTEKDKSDATNSTVKIIGSVINVTQIIGMGVAILMLTIVGIKWIVASPSGKAEYAKTARTYILGAVFIFSAVGILQIIRNFTKGLEKEIHE